MVQIVNSIAFKFIILYILPVILVWRYNKLTYSERGIDSEKKPEVIDIICNFLPGLNIIFCAIWFIEYPIARDKDGTKRTFAERLYKKKS